MIIFCTIYYICSYTQTIPQIIRLIKRKSSNDYSLVHLGISFLGLTCWTIFIFTSNQATLVYIGTAIDMALVILIDSLILHYYDFKKDKKEAIEKQQQKNT